MTPDSIQQIVSGQQFPETRHQLRQHREGLRLKRAPLTIPFEGSIRGIEFAITAAVNDLIQSHLPGRVHPVIHGP